MLLHAVVIGLFFIVIRQKPFVAAQSPPGVSVVFDNAGQQQPQAPPAQIQGPPTPATTPPPAAPPPPESDQPEVNLEMPELPPTSLPAPAPAPQTLRQAQRRPTPYRRQTQRYTVMNDLSFGKPSPNLPNARPGLNLSLSQSDQNVMNGPEISIKGDAGSDWNAALDKWVEDHKYYPDSAVEQGQEGNVRIRFSVDRAGNVTALHMVSGSGSPFLDQAWFGLFQDAQLPPFPADARDNSVTVDATMHFVLLR